METIQCTGITYSDGRKEIRYYVDVVSNSNGVAIVSYPILTSAQVDEIHRETIANLHSLLSKYF